MASVLCLLPACSWGPHHSGNSTAEGGALALSLAWSHNAGSLAGSLRGFLSTAEAQLVPSFSFGENDLFRQVVFEKGSWMRSIQHCCQKMMGFTPCVFYGQGLTSIQSQGFHPYAHDHRR